MSICAYCGQPYITRDSEHLFPHGLGGSHVLVNFVCNPCNQGFSSLEASLMRDSPAALARLSHDMSRNHNELLGTGNFLRGYGVQEVLSINNWVLSKIIRGYQTIVLSQIIQRNNSDEFLSYIINERQNSILIQGLETVFGSESNFQSIGSTLDSITFNNIVPSGNIKQLYIEDQEYNIFLLLKSSLHVGLSNNEVLFNRVFLDELARINIVANNENEAKRVLCGAVQAVLRVNPNNEVRILDSAVSNTVRSTLGIRLFESRRAAAKIVLNVLFYRFEELRFQSEFLPIKNYIRHNHVFDDGNNYARQLPNTFNNYHSIFLISNENGFFMSLELFAHFSYQFTIPLVENSTEHFMKIFLVDYENRDQYFLNID